MRLAVIADIHGNDVALRAVIKDAVRSGVDRWWALGDLVLFGPRPAEVLELLQGLPGIAMLRGNTDRYVLTGEQPAPHATAADAAGNLDLVERFAAMAAGIGWTRGVLDQAGLLATLTSLPAQLRLRVPSGTSVLGVHASPLADDGPGIEPGIADEELRTLLAGCGADMVIGGSAALMGAAAGPGDARAAGIEHPDAGNDAIGDEMRMAPDDHVGSATGEHRAERFTGDAGLDPRAVVGLR